MNFLFLLFFYEMNSKKFVEQLKIIKLNNFHPFMKIKKKIRLRMALMLSTYRSRIFHPTALKSIYYIPRNIASTLQ